MLHSRFRLAVVAVTALLGAPAFAQAQPPVLVAVSTGATSDASAQFVAIREYAPTDLTGWSITVQGSSGASRVDFEDFTTNPQTSGNGMVLVATNTAMAAYAVTPSVVAGTASLTVAGGRACLVDTTSTEIDCVAWGQYTGTNGTWGSPVVGGGQLGTELERIKYTELNTTDWQVTTADPSPFGLNSGADGGFPDGGLVDGGTVDGGTVDGGTVDGGTTDGGVTDGGTTDGGVTDGGTTDGGTGDGGGSGSGGVPAPGGNNIPTTATGCNCSTAGGGFAPGLLFALLGLLVLRRRRPVDPEGGRR